MQLLPQPSDPSARDRHVIPRRLWGRVTLIAAMSAVLLGITAATWAAEVPGNAANLDFAPYYASALLFRDGHAAVMYDTNAQSSVLREAGDASPSRIATALTPPAVLVDVPLTFAPLWLASLLWSGVQVLLLLVAALVALRAAPWAATIARTTRLLVAAAVLSGGGTLMLLGLNQWDGVAAAALALTYADVRAGRDSRALLWLTLGVLADKPHLAIGMALFLVARRPRSVIPAAAAAAALCALTLLAVPVQALGAWWSTIVHVNGAFPASSTMGVSGLVASWFGSGAASTTLGYVVIAAVLSGCVALGRAASRQHTVSPSRRGQRLAIDPLFLGVTLLSLLAAPHAFPYDLVLLIPGLIGCLAWSATADGTGTWPGRLTLTVLGGWFAITLVCLEIVSPPGSYRPTALLPILLVASAAGCLVSARHADHWEVIDAARSAGWYGAL